MGWNRAIVASLLMIAAALLFSVFLLLKPNSLALANIAVLVSAVLVGSGLGLLLRTRPALVSFSVVASIADVLSTSGGITNAVSVAYREGTSNLMLLLSVSCPFEGRVHQVIGIGDLVVLTAIFFALRRLGYRGALAVLAPISGLFVALVVGILVGGVFAIPFIAATTLGYLAIAKAEAPRSADAS